MNVKRLTIELVIIILFTISIFLGVNSYTSANLLLNILCSILTIIEVKNISGNYINISLFFVGFSVLYGLSGPINALWGEGLHAIFSYPYHIDEFLIAYAIANIGLICGIIIYNLIKKDKSTNQQINKSIEFIIRNEKKLYRTSIVVVIIGVVFEIINFIRIGGYVTLFSGKAVYQGLSAELTFTLPSEIIITIGFSLLGLYLGAYRKYNKKIPKKKIFNLILLLLVSSPFLTINLLLGKRGILLTLFLCIFVGINFFDPIKKVRPKLVITVVILYLFMSFIYANRAIVPLIVENPSLFVERAFSKERLITALNPGTSEFGAAFGNYSEFYKKYNSDFKPKLGTTYIKGLVIPIPSFIYPGDKPKQIDFEFRDEFFPSEARRSSIAGTGFSSILEAFMNFKYIGIFFVYLFIGYLLQVIDNKYKYKNLTTMMLYVSSFSLTRTFHRSSFGVVFGSIFLNLVVILFVRVCVRVSKSVVLIKNNDDVLINE